MSLFQQVFFFTFFTSNSHVVTPTVYFSDGYPPLCIVMHGFCFVSTTLGGRISKSGRESWKGHEAGCGGASGHWYAAFNSKISIGDWTVEPRTSIGTALLTGTSVGRVE